MKYKTVIWNGRPQAFVKIDSFSQEEKQDYRFEVEEQILTNDLLCHIYSCLAGIGISLLLIQAILFLFPEVIIKGSRPLWMVTLFSTRVGHDITVVFVLLTALAVITEHARTIHFALWEYTFAKLSQLPLEIFVIPGLVIGLTIAACIPWDYAYPAQWALLIFLVKAIFSRILAGDLARMSLENVKKFAGVQPPKESPKEELLQRQKSYALRKHFSIRGSRQKGMKLLQLCDACQQGGLSEQCEHCKKIYQHEIQRVSSQLLRANQAGVSATLTLAEWLQTLHNFHWQCAYCQTGPYEVMEHYIPISQGGGTTGENCVPGCYRCNTQKSNRHPQKEFLQSIKE